MRIVNNNIHERLNQHIIKNKQKLSDAKLKGAHLREVVKVSDNPAATTDILNISSSLVNDKQYIKNSDSALFYLQGAETALASLGEVLIRAKELAVQQASNTLSTDVRKSIAEEIKNIRQEALVLSNHKVGSKYLFSGFKTLSPAFNSEGQYQGDNGTTKIEISQNIEVPINIPGKEIFFIQSGKEGEESEGGGQSIFTVLDNLFNGMVKGDVNLIRSTLEPLEDVRAHIVNKRAKIGTTLSSLDSRKNYLEEKGIIDAERKSILADADLAVVFSEITKQETALNGIYKAFGGVLNKNLLDFINI